MQRDKWWRRPSGSPRKSQKGVKTSRKLIDQLRLKALQAELERMIPLVQQVMRQAKARLFRGDLHASDKLVSLFETATQIIRKGKSSKPTEFGRLIKIQEAENQIITDYEVCDQRPADSSLLTKSIEAHQQKLGRVPHTVATDAGFFSAQNEEAATKMGRQTCCDSKSVNQKCRTAAITKETMVSPGAGLANRMRGPDQCT
jgi:transposase, IS5 family